jgi:hypothetical protein
MIVLFSVLRNSGVNRIPARGKPTINISKQRSVSLNLAATKRDLCKKISVNLRK